MENFAWVAPFPVANLNQPGLPAATPPLAPFGGAARYDNFALSPLIKNYSDLASKTIELELGTRYDITRSLNLTARVGTRVYVDDEPYVYGDLDGEIYYGTAGVGYSF